MAQPLSAVLFDMLAEGSNRETPEGRAALRKRLLEMAERINDKMLAGEYRAMLLDRFFAERPRNNGFRGDGFKTDRAQNRAQITKRGMGSGRVAIDPGEADAERGRILTAILIVHPALLPDVEEAFSLIDLPVSCARLRIAFSAFHDGNESLDSGRLLTHLHESGLSADASRVLASSLPTCASPGSSLGEAADGWWHMFGLMRASRNRLREQRDEQQRHYIENLDDVVALEKLNKLNAALIRAERGEADADS